MLYIHHRACSRIMAAMMLSLSCLLGMPRPAVAHENPVPEVGQDGNLKMTVNSQITSPANAVNYQTPINLQFTTDAPHQIILNNTVNAAQSFEYRWTSEISFFGGTWGVAPTTVDQKKSPGYDQGAWVTWAAAPNGELTISTDVALAGLQQFDFGEDGMLPMTAQSMLAITSRAGNVIVGVGHTHSFGLL